ncbi:AraC family transcriptional regulator [Actinomycetaceae bacterium L2_0104]
MASIRMQPVGQTPRFVADAVALMREQLGSELTVIDLADHVGYSRYHFSRMFAEVTGLAPTEYLAALRFAEAKRLLLITDEPVVDVCAEVGFTSLSTFSRRFRRVVGTAPAGLRRLADDVSERPVVPFAVSEPGQPSIVVRLDLDGAAGGALQWQGEVTRPPRPAEQSRAEIAVEENRAARRALYEALRMPRLTWIGWYSRPVPVGLPEAGVLLSGEGPVKLPLCAGHPWLLAVSMRADADPLEQLAPIVPLVAAHPAPITPTTLVAGTTLEILLRFAPAGPHNVPLLSALASLRS